VAPKRRPRGKARPNTQLGKHQRLLLLALVGHVLGRANTRVPWKLSEIFSGKAVSSPLYSRALRGLAKRRLVRLNKSGSRVISVDLLQDAIHLAVNIVQEGHKRIRAAGPPGSPTDPLMGWERAMNFPEGTLREYLEGGSNGLPEGLLAEIIKWLIEQEMS
jgi:hypothetical protein